ncbi:amidase [Rhodopseudomonas sp. HC1]|uniref:amidase n=1 Tax=Rhodopseudomonas infernalis TaxID=2897386 RepID=UPI001EE85CD4|nr:amidase [Rhodopseudomonas infernalis]MCG6206758.1 amidase [Rhodopseudomonas infernalis]
MSDGISTTATALHELSATELLAGYYTKQFSPTDVMDAVIAQAERWEPHINALYAFDPDGARIAARASTERWQKGEPQGMLDGIPVTIKENVATKGTPVPLGVPITALTPAAVDAPPAARLREAGGIVWSKTTMPDFGMLSSGLSSFHGITRNPWDVTQNTGGSSAGAGAAGAAGYGPLHLGTDIGGSVRLPANWCGIFALKPSLGRVPIDPPYVGRCAGPMTRTVDDSALMMSVLSQPDPRDGMSLPPQDIAWSELDVDLRGKKIGLLTDLGFGMALEDDVRRVVTDAARLLESQGAIVEEVELGFTREMMNGLDAFWRARMWDDVFKLSEAQRTQVLPYIVRWAEGGATLSGVEVVRGFNQTMAVRAMGAKLFEKIDYLISPVAPVVSFAADLPSPLDDPDLPFDHILYTVPWNMAENPAASINGGYSSSGFPIGVQIVGRRYDDLGVLRIAKAFEGVRGAQKPWPQTPR